MKSNSLKGKPYNKLVSRLFLQTLALLIGACLFILVLRYVFMGQFADGIVGFISSVGQMDWYAAQGIYQYYVRNNLVLIIAVSIVVVFLILFRLLLSWFTRYFDEMVAGVENLAAEVDEDIKMTPELNFMESKLNEVKATLKLREANAKSAEQRKNELVVYLAHDIRTPLTSVVGYLSLLEEAPDMPIDQRAKYIHVSLEKAERLETLINEFFEITRYHFQSAPLEKSEIDLGYMLVQLTDEMYPLLKARGQWIETEVEENMKIYGDGDKLARVFNNILKNAAAYGEADSAVTIMARQTAESSIVLFRSKGEIPAAQSAAIFEKFYRLDAARSSATGGAGLGLAIARDIMTLHGGDIDAAGDDGFTVFRLELPRAAK